MSIENNIERILSVVEEIKERLKSIEGVSVSTPTPPPIAEKKIPTPPPITEKKIPTPPTVIPGPQTFNELAVVLQNIMKSCTTSKPADTYKSVMEVVKTYDPVFIDGSKTEPYLSRVPKESWVSLIKKVETVLNYEQYNVELEQE